MLVKNVRKIAAVLLVSTLMSLGSASFADKTKDLRTEQEGIKKKLNTTQDKIKKAQKESKSVEQQIEDLDKKANTASIELGKVEDELSLLGKSISKNEKDLEEAEKKLIEKQENFESRIRVMYMNGNVGYLELLLTSKDLKDFFSRREMVQAIAEQDKELLQVMKEQKDIIEEKKKELEAQRASLSTAKTELQSRKDELETATREKEVLMTRLQKDVENFEKEYDKLNAFAGEIEGQILKLQAEQRAREEAKNKKPSTSGGGSVGSTPDTPSSETPTGGKMTWPVPGSGKVSSYFGYRIHPIFNTKKLHTGIDIPAPAGRNVVAATNGTVIYSGWFGGYGNTIMIDHGGGIVTLYAHNSSLTVSKGQSVARGAVIAKIGSTGNSTGPHSHFEVRQNGKYIDPLPWIR